MDTLKYTEAIILAGGLGTRLRSVISEIPKPMAPVAGKPFLWYLLETLYQQGITRVILSVGYKWEVIADYFGSAYKTMSLEYSVEETPMGTGGGIKLALAKCSQTKVFLLNGDTFFDVNLKILEDVNSADVVLSLRKMVAFDRYGTVLLDSNQRVLAFADKKYCDEGLINGGVYLVGTDILDAFGSAEKFSFESHFLEKSCESRVLTGIEFDNYFIDIGIPEDFQRAQSDFENKF